MQCYSHFICDYSIIIYYFIIIVDVFSISIACCYSLSCSPFIILVMIIFFYNRTVILQVLLIVIFIVNS